MRRIAIDFDGVIADTNLMKSQYVKRVYDVDIERHLCDKSNFCRLYSAEQYQSMVSELYTGPMTAVTPPIAGVEASIARLASAFQLFLVTNRSAPRLAWAKEWLHSRELFRFFSGFESSSCTTKERICRALGVAALIDDDIRHLECPASYSRVLFINQPGLTSKVLDDLYHCYSWGQIESVLAGLDKEYDA